MDAVIATGVVICTVLTLLVHSNKNTDLIIWAGVAVLIFIPVKKTTGTIEIGIISLAEATAGIANEGVVAIAALFVVAAGVKETGLMNVILGKLFKDIKSNTEARLRILGPTSFVSAFFNNTPLMALLVPAINQSARKYGFSPSHILMPLSFAAILGGACTLIGTNTNLIINGWLIESTNHAGFKIFEITPIMLPGAIVGIVFLILFSPKLLRERLPVLTQLGDLADYTVEMMVEPNSEIIGQTVTKAGLRGLEGLYLIEIVRRNQSLAAVSSNVRIEANDRLYFVGATEFKSQLDRIDGLTEPKEKNFRLFESTNRNFVEVVIKGSSPVIGRSIRASRFRTIYSAAILAVARNGSHIKGRIGDITLKEADTLLLETRSNFLSDPRKKEDFFVVSESAKPREKDFFPTFLPFAIVLTMIAIVTMEFTSLMVASVAAATAMILGKCCSLATARKAIDWQILFTIAGTLALGKAMMESGLASVISSQILSVLPTSATLYLSVFFLLSSIASNLVSSKAGALFVLPIAASTAEMLTIPLTPLVLIIMMGASMAVASPLTYPTNLMVYGPGGYFFSDYIKLGIPVTLLIGFVGVLLIRTLFPF